MSAQVSPPKYVFGTRWLWVMVCVFAAGEWAILFYPGLWQSFSFLRQEPRAVVCSDWLEPATAFLRLRAWVIVSLAQAIIWGVVTYTSIRYLIGLWPTGEPAARWRRVVNVVFRSMMFSLGLWFFLEPAPRWDFGCFSQHMNVRGAGALAYVAVGSATIVMWVLEDRVGNLAVTRPDLEVTLKYLELRQKLQTLLSLASLILTFGIIGLVTRRAFIDISHRSFYEQPITLEGFEYTILLGLAYAPVHAAFNSVGKNIRDGLMPRPSKDSVTAVQEWSRLSNELGDLMQIGLYDWKSLGPIFPILAPFLLGLLSAFARR